MPDPEPLEAVTAFLGERAVVEADPHGVKNSHLFEAERGVPGIGLEKGKVLVGQSPDARWKLALVEPEVRVGKVVQSGVQRPAS